LRGAVSHVLRVKLAATWTDPGQSRRFNKPLYCHIILYWPLDCAWEEVRQKVWGCIVEILKLNF